jgi:hypothetical protein
MANRSQLLAQVASVLNTTGSNVIQSARSLSLRALLNTIIQSCSNLEDEASQMITDYTATVNYSQFVQLTSTSAECVLPDIPARAIALVVLQKHSERFIGGSITSVACLPFKFSNTHPNTTPISPGITASDPVSETLFSLNTSPQGFSYDNPTPIRLFINVTGGSVTDLTQGEVTLTIKYILA